MTDEIDRVRVESILFRRIRIHRPPRKVLGILDATGDSILALAAPRAAVMWNDNRDTRAAKVVRDIVPARKARESVAEDDARPWPRELRGRNKHLSVDRAPFALEYKCIELWQFRLARELLFRTAASQRHCGNCNKHHSRIHFT